MSVYIGNNIFELEVLTPVEGATPPSELNDSDREIKRALKNQFAIATKTAAYTLLGSDHIILANGTFNITLPTASDVAGSGYKKQYTIINIGTGIATIVGTVDGVSNPTIPTQYSSMTIETDGSAFYSISPKNSDMLDGKHISDIQNGSLVYCAISGTDTYTGTLSPAITTYTQGMKVLGKVSNANGSTAPTLNLNAVAAKKIFKEGGLALEAGDIPAGHHALFSYDSTLDTGSGGWLLLNVSKKISQSGAEIYALATGTDTYAATLNPPITVYTTGLEVHIKIPNANTLTAPTLDINSVAAKTIFNPSGLSLIAGELKANGHYTFIYDSTLDSGNGGWIVKNSSNADKLDGYDAGNSSGQVPVSNGTVCSNLNADMLDGVHYSNTATKSVVGEGDEKPAQTEICLNGSFSSTGIPYINYNEHYDHSES